MKVINLLKFPWIIKIKGQFSLLIIINSLRYFSEALVHLLNETDNDLDFDHGLLFIR